MTPDPVDAALDIWFQDGFNWRLSSLIYDYRTRMRRVLDAHDAGNPNTLPMEELPEGFIVEAMGHAHKLDHSLEWYCDLTGQNRRFAGYGPTPRAAMLAAIEAAKERK